MKWHRDRHQQLTCFAGHLRSLSESEQQYVRFRNNLNIACYLICCNLMRCMFGMTIVSVKSLELIYTPYHTV